MEKKKIRDEMARAERLKVPAQSPRTAFVCIVNAFFRMMLTASLNE
jgi:hypothetical protein